jgi:hypothetical protein
LYRPALTSTGQLRMVAAVARDKPKPVLYRVTIAAEPLPR